MSTLKYVVCGVVLLLLIVCIVTSYVKAPPDVAYIISGLGKKARIVVGKASLKLPFLERLDKLYLNLMSVDVKTSSPVPTADYINITVDAVVNIQIEIDDTDSRELAQKNFLNKKDDYIIKTAREVLEGNMREIVGTMELRDMVSNRQKFAEKVKENATPDLASMGLKLISFNVQNFSDGQGVIENLGIDNVAKIQKDASIAKANAGRDVSIAESLASKEANDARVAADLEIAQKDNDLLIKKAELKRVSDIKKAEADAAYKIQQEEQRKQIEITTANADIARQEREIELKRKEAEVTEQALDAEVKKKAEAQKYAEQQKADAELYTRQRDAEAKKFEETQAAEAQKIKAEYAKQAAVAEAEAIKAKAIAEAEAVRQRGIAEAEAVRAKALAEAEGLDKKAEAMQKMQEAAILQMYFEKLPDIARAVAEPLANIDKITMYGDGNTTKLVGDITRSATQISDGMLDSLGISLKELVGGVITGKAVGTGINSVMPSTTTVSDDIDLNTSTESISDGMKIN